MAADFCRLCLRPIDKAKSTDLVTETTKSAMLKEFLPEMNLDISENTQVCSSCIEELETSYNFKHGVVVNETNIQTKLEENDLKKIDLKLMLDDVAKKEVKTADYVCRTCFSICRTPSISLFDSPTNMMPYSFVKKMCQVVFELEFIAADKPVLCDDCWETLQTVYNFRKCCLRTDKKLRIFVANKNITKVNNDEFKEFAEENPPKDDAEDSSDDELDEYIKEEPVDADEIKFDPDEASCSSSSVKVKKETAVKSESELNSEDEDMEDEPELLDPKTIKSEASELDGEECKMEIGDVKVDAEGEGSAGPSGCFGGKESAKNRRSSAFQCSEGSYRSKTKQDMTKHRLVHAYPSTLPMFKCTECSYITKRKNNFNAHKLVHAADGTVPLFNCSECAFRTKRRTTLKSHQRIHAEPGTVPLFQCTECSYKSFTKSRLAVHKLSHAKPGSVPTFRCTECLFETKRAVYLEKHKKFIHALPGTFPTFRCMECSFETKHKNSLKRHRVKHAQKHLIPVFRCSQCPFESKRKRSLIYHELEHSGVPIYRCTVCLFITKRSEMLTRHLKRVHDSPRPVQIFSCANCSYETNRKFSLQQHTLIHAAPGTIPIFACSKCSFKSNKKRNLVRHCRNMHEQKMEPSMTSENFF